MAKQLDKNLRISESKYKGLIEKKVLWYNIHRHIIDTYQSWFRNEVLRWLMANTNMEEIKNGRSRSF